MCRTEVLLLVHLWTKLASPNKETGVPFSRLFQDKTVRFRIQADIQIAYRILSRHADSRHTDSIHNSRRHTDFEQINLRKSLIYTLYFSQGCYILFQFQVKASIQNLSRHTDSIQI